jgi:uncharacterized metal-binding protein
VKPIDLSTPISFVYSYKLADMFAERAKKHRNIVTPIIVLNTLSNMLVILLFVLELEAECV